MSFSWTEERVELAKHLCLEEGLSAALIAEKLGGGITRNAVIGKLNRLGIFRPGRRKRAPVERPKTKPIAENPAPKADATVTAPQDPPNRPSLGIRFTPTRDERLQAARNAVEKFEEAQPPEPEFPAGVGIHFLARRHGQCAEILSRPSGEDVRCCGNRVEQEGASYCRHHAAKNYIRREPAPPKPRPSMWDDEANVEKLRALRDSGKTQGEAAQAMGVGLSTIERGVHCCLGAWAKVST